MIPAVRDFSREPSRKASGVSRAPGPAKRYWSKNELMYPLLARYRSTNASDRSGSMARESFHQPPAMNTLPRPSRSPRAILSVTCESRRLGMVVRSRLRHHAGPAPPRGPHRLRERARMGPARPDALPRRGRVIACGAATVAIRASVVGTAEPRIARIGSISASRVFTLRESIHDDSRSSA